MLEILIEILGSLFAEAIQQIEIIISRPVNFIGPEWDNSDTSVRRWAEILISSQKIKAKKLNKRKTHHVNYILSTFAFKVVFPL